MKKIIFENMPDTYEKDNLIFFKEPYKVDAIAWGIAHSGCKALILKRTDYNTCDVSIVAFPKSKEFNIDLYSILESNRDKYMILNQYGGGGLEEVYNESNLE